MLDFFFMVDSLTFADIIEYAEKNWQSFKLNYEKPEKFDVSGFNVRKVGDHATRCFKIVDQKSSLPILILKMPQKPGSHIAEDTLNNEFNLLKKLNNNKALESLKNNIPTVIEITRIKDSLIIIEKAFQGNNLELLIGIDPEERIANLVFSKILNVLYKIHTATKGKKVVINEETIHNNIIKPFDIIEHKYEQKLSIIKEYLQNQIKKYSNLYGTEIPLSLTHGDFNPWNIILQKNDFFGIIDWEDFEKEGFFLRDLFYFFIVYTWELFYGEQAKENNQKQGTSYLKNKMNWYPKLIKEKVIDFFKLINMPEDSIDLFFLLFLVKNTLIDLEDKRSINKTSAKRWIDILNLRLKDDIFFNSIDKIVQASILQ